MDFEPLIDTFEAARFLNFSAVQIRRLAGKGLIPAAKYGSEWRFRKSELARAFTEAVQRNQNSEQQKAVPAASPAIAAPTFDAPIRRGRGRPRSNRGDL